MEEEDAVQLLLISAAQDATPNNRTAASEIVKVSAMFIHIVDFYHLLLGVMVSTPCYHTGWGIHPEVWGNQDLFGSLCY
jgi:hypothetical protein